MRYWLVSPGWYLCRRYYFEVPHVLLIHRLVGDIPHHQENQTCPVGSSCGNVHHHVRLFVDLFVHSVDHVQGRWYRLFLSRHLSHWFSQNMHCDRVPDLVGTRLRGLSFGSCLVQPSCWRDRWFGKMYR